MPVANPQKDAQNQLLQHYQQFLPKSPTCHLTSQLSPGADNYIGREDAATLVTDLHEHLTGLPPAAAGDRASGFFSTHSPPILNLSPNLSPSASEPQRVSPTYDLRETTRRRTHYGELQNSCNQPMQTPAQIYSEILDDAGRKSESPSRKRRKTSNSYIDLTNNSPSPPPTWAREATEAARLGVSRRRVSSQRRTSGDRRGATERCTTPRARRSPGTRRRTRDRNNSRQNDSSPERRAFQPPNMMNHPGIHPASLAHHHPHAVPTGQQHVMYDLEQVPVSAAVNMAPYTIPVCTGHHIPVCNATHIPVCSSQPTWSIPGCNVQLPTCNMQHIPACSLPQIPFHPNSIPPLFHHAHHPVANQIPPQQLAPPTQFVPGARAHPEEDVPGLLDHRPRYTLQSQIHQHGTQPFTTTAPVMLQEPHVHPSPHDFYGPFPPRHYARHRSGGRVGRLRSLPLPPPPYPGFLLHFLAMLGNPPIPPYGRDFHDDATEVENYEALLNLAERLGEAKPKGLTKAEIEQLPAYRFNKETHHSDMDQTSCVVCMCDFENRQLLRVLPCSHEFHAKCVDKWLKTNRTCPICRADATSVEAASQSD